MLELLLAVIIAMLAMITCTVAVNMFVGPFLRRAGRGDGKSGSESPAAADAPSPSLQTGTRDVAALDAETFATSGAALPSVSVCIPARNEESNIDVLLSALRSQRLQPLEIIVLDDQSEDGTAAVVRRHAGEDERIRLQQGVALPPGWTGKNWACHQLAGGARGDVLLFVDADVRPSPDAVAHTLRAMRRYHADALSAFPRQQLDSLAAAAVIPVMDLLLYGFLPLPLVHRSRAVSLAAANGQWFAFRRPIYTRIGGHTAVKGEIVEDVALARTVKRVGGRMLLTVGTGSVSCRMYKRVAEIREGFSKNFFAAFGFNTPAFLAVLALLAGVFVLPFFLLFTSAWPLALVAIGLNLVIRGLLSWRAGHGLAAMLLHPFGVLAAVFIGVEAILLRYRHGAVGWKGRRISVGDAR